MATTEKYALGTIATLMSTELNSLASSAMTAGAIASAAYNNTQGGGGGDGYTIGEFELVIGTPAGSLNAGSGVFIWLLAQPDGTNYEDGGAAVIPQRSPNIIIPVRAVATAQRITISDVPLPPGLMKALVVQNTGQTWAASGNTLKLLPYTRQAV